MEHCDSEKIKVDKKVRPVHFSQREQVELVIGKEYYVSFGENTVQRCKLTSIDEKTGMITVEIPTKTGYDNGLAGRRTLFSNEIGLTPEEAVINEVSL
jgi:hypothetical protein